MFFLPCAEKYGDNEFHGGKTFEKNNPGRSDCGQKRTLGQISFIMQKQTDNPVLSMISCTVQKQMVQKCSKKKQMAVARMKDTQRFQRVCPKNGNCDQQKTFFSQQIKTSNTNK